MISLKQMLRATPAEIRRNATQVSAKVTKSLEVKQDEKHVTLIARSLPSSGSGKKHNVVIKLFGPVKQKSDVLKAKAWVHCDCEWFQYNCEVALARIGSSDIISSTGANPKEKNPMMKPMVCKHIVSTLPKIAQIKFKKATPTYLKQNPKSSLDSAIAKIQRALDSALSIFPDKKR